MKHMLTRTAVVLGALILVVGVPVVYAQDTVQQEQNQTQPGTTTAPSNWWWLLPLLAVPLLLMLLPRRNDNEEMRHEDAGMVGTKGGEAVRDRDNDDRV